MAANTEMENGVPGQQPYEQILELRKQLEVGPKHVKLQLLDNGILGEQSAYVMMLGNEHLQDSATNQPPTDDDTLEPESIEECELSVPTQQDTKAIYVQSTLGHGGFGFVYKAQVGKEDQMNPICLKLGLHKKKYENEDERKRGQEEVNVSILREAEHYRTLSKYPHPNTVSMQFCCVSIDYNEVFLALDYCKGFPLSYYIDQYKEKNLPTKLLHKIMLESTRAVKHCLSLGIIHCDIKPSNVLYLSMEKPLKLIDFGCAVHIEEGIDPYRDTAGTYEYMPPEMLVYGLYALDAKSDVYSLGAMFSKVITRRTPWSHLESMRAAWADRKKRSEVKKIIKKELQRSSEESAVQLELTSLQSIVIDRESIHFSHLPEQCNLISSMLSFHHSKRPSCEDVLELIPTIFKKSKKTAAAVGAPEADDGSSIPAPVFSCNTTNSKDKVTSSLVAASRGDTSTGDPLIEPTESSLFFGPPSGESLIAEDVKDDYGDALLDLHQMMAEFHSRRWSYNQDEYEDHFYDDEDYDLEDFLVDDSSYMFVDRSDSPVYL